MPSAVEERGVEDSGRNSYDVRKQREDFHTALAETKLDLYKALMGHLWKLYGFASLMLGGVYFIARYVH